MKKNIIASLITRGSVAFLNLAILLLATRLLGSTVWGQVSLLVLNMAIVQAINDVYTGSAIVHFIPGSHPGKIYRTGIVWTFLCIIVVNLVFYVFSVGLREQWIHVMCLSLFSTLHAFHNVLLLSRQKIRQYNFLLFLQPATLLTGLVITILVLDILTVNAYIYAYYGAILLSLGFSTVMAYLHFRTSELSPASYNARYIFRNGIINELGNLAHTLSNRFNYYMLESNLVLVGVYASGSSLIESVWVISASISPLVLTHIANNVAHDNSAVTFRLAKLCFGIGLAGVLILLFIPPAFFTGLLGNGFAGVKTVMLLLSPGVLFISFSSIISHYYSAQGKQKILLKANASGLIVTLCTSYFFISRYGLAGACYSASLSYMVQASVLIIVFMRENGLRPSRLFS